MALCNNEEAPIRARIADVKSSSGGDQFIWPWKNRDDVSARCTLVETDLNFRGMGKKCNK